MASNIFSRFNTNAGRSGGGSGESRSFYKELRSGEAGDAGDNAGFEDRAGLALDEENLNQQFHDYDLESNDALGIDDSRLTLEHATSAAGARSGAGKIAGGPASSAAAAAGRGARVSPAAAARMAGGQGQGQDVQGRARHSRSRSRWGAPAEDDFDDDVPGSLLVEAHGAETAPLPPMLKATPLRAHPSHAHPAKDRRSRVPSGGGGPIPGAPTPKNRTQWEAAQNQQRLHRDDYGGSGGGGGNIGGPPAAVGGRGAGRDGTHSSTPGHALLSYFTSGSNQKSTAYDRAMWRWVNVSNLDNFIRDVYNYYRDSGLRCIMLARFLHLVNVAFVAVFLTFLTQCVDYTSSRGSTKMEQLLVPQCTKNMSWVWNLGLWLFAFYFIWKTMQFFIFDVRRLLNLRDFYVHLLQIPEHDMQTVSWQDVVVKIMALRDHNPKTATNMTRLQREWIGSQSKERLDAHDIANRLMRRENYLIALFNKDILDLSIPLPLLRNTQLLTRTLEWTLWFGVLDFVFDERGQVSQEFLKASRRTQLSLKLKSRFLFAGFMNLLLAPFVACYLVVVYFLTYYNEYQKNPSALGARGYTPLAEWKFREFNELEHLFQERLNMSYPFATRYLDQFPKRGTEQVARTVTFISGALWTVLAIATLLDPDPLFLGMEITRGHTVLFYVGVFASVWAAARGMITEDNSVFDPEYALRNVIEYTHYEPDHWKGRLHSYDVKVEFSELYQLKIRIFFEEIMSILFTPLILFTSLPRSSDQIVDFFREFTIHVDGLGYVCSFAEFDFHKGVGGAAGASSGKHGSNKRQPEPPVAHPLDPLGADGGDVRDDYYATKHGKMAASYYGFLDNYVINPKTGIPGHHPPGGAGGNSARAHYQHFHHPPAFPGLNSPTLAADMQSSRIRHRGGNQAGQTGQTGQNQPAALRTPHFGASSVAHPSPMASILLDPHHQPSGIAMTSRSVHRPRGSGGGTVTGGRYGAAAAGESYIVEEPDAESRVDADEHGAPPHAMTHNSSEGLLEESTWQTAPPANLSRESSGVDDGDGDVGVLGLMYQFQQAHQNQRGSLV